MLFRVILWLIFHCPNSITLLDVSPLASVSQNGIIGFVDVFSTTLTLLSTGHGTLIYHLLILLSMEAVAGISLVEYRHTHNPDQQRILWAFSILFVLRIPLLAGQLVDSGLLSPLLYAMEVISQLLLWWAFLSPLLKRQVGRAVLIGGLLLTALLTLVFFPLWYREITALPAEILQEADFSLQYMSFWQQPMWDLLAVLVPLSATALLLLNRRRLGYSLPAVAFGLITLGNVLILFDQVGLGRLVNLLGFPLLAVTVYRGALQDLWSYQQELESLSGGALRQTQELLYMVQIGQTIGESLDLDTVLQRVVESIAHALNADRVAIFLVEDETNHLRLVAQYALLQIRPPAASTITVLTDDQPLLAHAVQRQRQLLLNPEGPSGQLDHLYRLLDSPEIGPTIIQPLMRQRKVLGALVAGNVQSKRPFEEKDGRLCNSIAAQISAAIDNARLYRHVDRQARSLAEMLTIQEEEAGRREAILESIAEGVIVTNTEGRAVLMNVAAEELLTIHRSQILGRLLQQILEPLKDEVKSSLAQLTKSTAPLQTLFELQRKQIHVSAAPVHLPSGELFGQVAVLRDVTREVQAERAKRDFIATISHELRTPLTAILGYTEVLYNGMVGELNQSQSRFVHIVHDNARRMIAMANNLIALSEAERGQLELKYDETDLHLLLNEIAQAFKPQLEERNMSWSIEMPDDLPAIEADPHRIHQIVSNLVSNAVKYTFPGGQISIGVEPVEASDQPTSQFFRIWVKDTGVGIPQADHTRIWERFYRADNPLKIEAGGLGVGLSIVKSLVEAHGGRVWLDSTLGHGSTFSVLLPSERPPASLMPTESDYPPLEEAVK